MLDPLSVMLGVTAPAVGVIVFFNRLGNTLEGLKTSVDKLNDGITALDKSMGVLQKTVDLKKNGRG